MLRCMLLILDLILGTGLKCCKYKHLSYLIDIEFKVTDLENFTLQILMFYVKDFKMFDTRMPE